MAKKSIAERFWEKVDKSGGPDACWIWTAGRTSTGYGQFMLGGVPRKAHRVSWQLVNGEIADGAFVCHKCDNTLCVNPAHAFLGNQTDNMRDCKQKGRNCHGERRSNIMRALGASGALSHPSKLCAEDVANIRRLQSLGVSQTAIARLAGVGQDHISRIVRGHLWKHVA